MYMIEISDSKVDKMSEYVEDMLWAGGELMHCLEKMKGEKSMSERGGMGYRNDGGYNSRYGMRSRYSNYNSRGSMGYRDDDDDDYEEMNERRLRDSRGRYM